MDFQNEMQSKPNSCTCSEKKGRFIRLPEVKARTGLSRTTIYEEIAKGKFPKNYPLGERIVGWLEADIDTWIAERLKMGC